MKSKKLQDLSLGIIFDSVLKIPPDTGATYRVYYLAKKLAENGVRVKIFLCNRIFKNSEEIIDFYGKERSLEFHIIPSSVFYNRRKLLKILETNFVDIIQCENPGHIINLGIPTSRRLGVPLCFDVHDIEHKLRKDLGYGDGEVEFSKKVDAFAAISSDGVMVFTPSDYENIVLEKGVKRGKVTIIPIGIDPGMFPCFGPNLKERNIIFLGNVFYPPNQEAVNLIAAEIYPRILKFNKGVKFTIIGMVPKKIRDKFTKSNFIFTGSVKNLNGCLKKGTVAICPVIRGSGMKVKILNYCAAGLPVITTTVGASGYEKLSSLVLENNIKKYPEKINELLNSPRKLKAIGSKNRLEIVKYYNWNNIADQAIRFYENIIKEYSAKNKTGEREDSQIPMPKNIPASLWLKEKRVGRIKNNIYYKMKNGKIIFKKRFG